MKEKEGWKKGRKDGKEEGRKEDGILVHFLLLE